MEPSSLPSFLAPLVLIAAAALTATRPGRRPGALPRLAEGAALVALALAGAGALRLIFAGPTYPLHDARSRPLFCASASAFFAEIGHTPSNPPSAVLLRGFSL